MLILIISIIVLIVGISLMFLGDKKYNDGIVFCGSTFAALGGFFVILCITLAVMSHTGVEYKYQKDYMEYEILQEQIDSGNYNSITITSDIVSYNQKVMGYRTYYNSPWVGLYYYEGCGKLPLLEIKGQN